MSEFLKNFIGAYASETVTGVIVALVTAFTSNVLYRSKLRKEQKVRFQDVVGKKIAEALLAVWDIERKTHAQETYDIENILSNGKGVVGFFNPKGVYLEIMSDEETFTNFVFSLNDARGEYEKYLSNKVAAHLWYGVNHFMEMTVFMTREGLGEKYPEMGIVFLPDILNWRNSFEKAIIKDINRHSTKLVAHRGARWEIAKKQLKHKLYKKNVLNEIISHKDSEVARLLYDYINELKAMKQEESRGQDNS